VKLSAELVANQAASTGFRTDILEKVAHLLGLLTAMQSHPALKGKLALKGGTALNLFLFDIPRLSVDIDLNYIGAENRREMLAERPQVERALQAVFEREDFSVRRMPDEHAGGKWSLRYQSTTGQSGNLAVDLNFMYRVPLWPIVHMDSRPLGPWQAQDIPVLDLHELTAGKLAALVARRQARDLFDSQLLLSRAHLDPAQLRLAFVVYGAMNRKDWRTISIEEIDFDIAELTRQLLPVLHPRAIPADYTPEDYGKSLVEQCRRALSIVLPFTDAEQTFLHELLDKGEVQPSILTDNKTLQERILRQPMLRWKAMHVKQHRDSLE
jgi:predicted nucleotidyltransferase component of viral defense system